MELNNPKVTHITDSQISSAGILLAETFFTDPLNQYVFPDPEERSRVLSWYFAASVREGAFLQSVYVTGEPIKGVAVWTPPGFHERTPERARHSGLDQIQRQFGPQAYQRFTGVINHLARFSSQVVPPAHWYLSLIGVFPACQGQGIGGALLAPVLLKADKEGTCCSLETFEEKTLSFYHRHGFQVVVAEIELYSQLRFWTMRRSPRTSPRPVRPLSLAGISFCPKEMKGHIGFISDDPAIMTRRNSKDIAGGQFIDRAIFHGNGCPPRNHHPHMRDLADGGASHRTNMC